ncbi:virulence RhuM family protein [Candidatus Saccharibacteria bacterium]|nr:virulence RhuM family protein [Candidatus Saccharibacteria bacterium]
MENSQGDIVLYESQDGKLKIDVKLEDETAWLSQHQLAELFQTSKQLISHHINNIFREGELDKNSVVKNYLTTAADGKKYRTSFYNLDMIISLGYRINSKIATVFRQWATARLKEYIIKGFTLDDERLKQNGGRYFKELLQRIRDIRSSERNLWQQVADIYATAIDYDKNSKTTKEFFATVQNKMHYAVHHQTAAEVVYN